MCRSAVNDGSCSPWVMCSCSVVRGNQIRDSDEVSTPHTNRFSTKIPECEHGKPCKISGDLRINNIFFLVAILEQRTYKRNNRNDIKYNVKQKIIKIHT